MKEYSAEVNIVEGEEHEIFEIIIYDKNGQKVEIIYVDQISLNLKGLW